ncbi:hypothetical protein F2Q69_00020030 [Brassica cretica]|uniref:Uncharacterized protein n=1 Tax=Brassica cretica TaxID=69181 RepID=A0A8S9QIA8_BRACR|nr:hypothetical protein F2Q69_00020030 [Brassica cretica]
MTLEVFVVSLDGLSFTIAGSSVTSPIPLSTIYVNPATDVGETPLRRPDLFLKRLRRQSSSSDISLPSSIISIPHVWPPPPFRSFKRGGNPLRRPALSHLFVNLASDVGGNSLRRLALSHQKLVRTCCRRTTLTSSFVVESTSLPCLLSMNGENFSDFFQSYSFSLFIGLLSCGAVSMGADDATLAAQTYMLPSSSPLAHGSELSTSAGASRPTGSTGSSHPFTIQNLHRHCAVRPSTRARFGRFEEPSGSLGLSLLVGSCV